MNRSAIILLGVSVIALALGCESSTDVTPPAADTIQLSVAQKKSLDSIGDVIKQANPNDLSLRSLVDSTLQVLNAGVEAKHVAVTTDLTASPLYFVGIHRAVSRPSGSFSTWTLVGFDSPSKLTYLIEVSGFAQNNTSTPPASVTGTIGDGTGVVNGRLMQVGANGSVTTFPATSGPVSFSSGSPGTACPGTLPPNVTCALETMRVRFTLGGGAKTASQGADVDVPAMRLTYTLP